MIIPVPIIRFMDDSLGNISKHALLPQEQVEKRSNIHFITSSPHATPMELTKGVQECLDAAAKDGVRTWDCKYNKEVVLIPFDLSKAGNNPMQAEESSQAGVACNFFCRTCTAGGTKVFKENVDGYKTLFKPGTLRTPSGTIAQIKKQVEEAQNSGGKGKVKTCVSETGMSNKAIQLIIETLITKRRQYQGGRQVPAAQEAVIQEQPAQDLQDLLGDHTLEECMNPLLHAAGFDVHQDTPTGILHTILLGVVKYFWGKPCTIFEAQLESVSLRGLGEVVLPAAYICKYQGSLIGKHFKALAQVMPVVIHGLFLEELVKAWLAIG
ncbi:hypothetical protein BDV98DRAFT_614531 [Pterulicium gracile]|uniref:Uncharacterized protein n=1 Tax=Pterulicium gracile TaxID=1884261 RepID=A0A5C3Q1B1_9AGAR|nr:hypothetical protein BDV98DRAFT_614531 [Pterula gracilis]